MEQAIGWIASIVLLLTLGSQVYEQWKHQTAQGVSYWLFTGQVTASSLFVVYSYIIGNWVFAFTNLGIFAVAVAGFTLTIRQKRRDRRAVSAT